MAATSHSPAARQPVVIADADTANVDDVRHQLRTAGVKNPILAFPAGDQLQAFLLGATAAADEEKPCVLFLDPRLPLAPGFDTVRWIRRQPALRNLKVVVFSRTNYPEEIESAGELGVHLFLKKHPDVSSLSRIVDHLCGVEKPEHAPWPSFRAPPPAEE